MKYTVLVLAGLLISFPLFSQINFQDIPMAQLIENKDYSFYVGTWKWEDTTSQSEFIIKLEIAKTIDPDWEVEYLKGGYLYKKNGMVVADYMKDLNSVKDFIDYPIYIFADRENHMRLRVMDFSIKNGRNVTKRHSGSSYVKYIAESPAQIEWKIIDDRHLGVLYADEKMVFPPGISLPEDIILTKVE